VGLRTTLPSFTRTIGIDVLELPECALARWYVARLAAEGREREAAGLELGVTAHVVARDVGTAVGEARAVAAGATPECVVGPDEHIDAIVVAGRLGRLLFPRARVDVLAAGARAQKQFRIARQLEQQLAANRPVVAVFGIGGASGGVVKERVVVIAFK